MTVPLDEQIAYVTDRLRWHPDQAMWQAIIASLRQLQQRTTALAECERLLQRASNTFQAEGRAADGLILGAQAQRARQALEEQRRDKLNAL